MQGLDYKFPSGLAWILATIGLRVEVLAHRVGARLETWEPDGLGTAHGFYLRLPSGRVVLLQELEHAVSDHGVAGPDVYVDGAEAATEGFERLLAEVSGALGLDIRAISWRPLDVQAWSDGAAQTIAHRQDAGPANPSA